MTLQIFALPHGIGTHILDFNLFHALSFRSKRGPTRLISKRSNYASQKAVGGGYLGNF